MVVRSSARAPRPSLVQGPGVDGLAGAADGIEPIARLARESHRAPNRLESRWNRRWRARLATLWLQIYSHAESDRFFASL